MMVGEIFTKYKEQILYLVFGVLTTLVNFVVYYLLIACSLHYSISNAIAIAISILFAYITNKIYVFESVTKSFREALAEFLRFVGSRIASSIYDMLSMFILISLLSCNELLAKIVTGVIVVILNYILSKKFAFTQQ